MFTRVEQLARDLDAVAGGTAPPSGVWSPEDSELGPAFVAAASGKYIWTDSDANSDEACRLRRRLAAQRSVAAMLFHPNATHYALLAARPDASAEELRDCYRRMIALVHPDTQPVGFPIDAATRVNRAYDLLSDPRRRAEYDFTLLRTDAPREASSGEKSHTRRMEDEQIAGSKSALSRVSLLRRLRFRASRRSLLWLAAGLAVSALSIVYLSAETEPGVALVEARPRLEMSTSVETVPHAEPAGSADAGSAPLTPPPPSVAGNSSTAATATGELAAPARRLSTELSAASRRIVDAFSPVAASASVKATTVPDATTKLASSPRASSSPSPSAKLNSLAATTSAHQPADTDVSKQTTFADSVASRDKAETSTKGPVVSNASQVSANATNTGSAPAETLQRIRAVDVDELLARFASAYESGSTPALAALLSQAMPSRRATLSDYEHVFQGTRQRTIRFSQVKHTWIGDHVSTSGLVTLTALGHDGQSTRQNAFLEIETALEANTLRVTRLASYAQR